MGLAARGLRVVSVTVGAGHGAGVPVAAGSRSRGFGKQRGLYERTPRSVHPTHRELRAEAPGAEGHPVSPTHPLVAELGPPWLPLY